MDGHQLDGGHPELDEMLEDGVHAEAEVGATERLRHAGVKLRQAAHVALVDHRATPRGEWRAVVAPAECGLDHDALRHDAGAVGRAGDVAGRVVRILPGELGARRDRPAERPGIGIDQQLRGIEAVTVTGRPGPVHAVAVELPGPHVGETRVPHEAVSFGERDACRFARVIRPVEQAELDRGGMLREEREVHPLAIPGGTERVGAAGPDAHPCMFTGAAAHLESRACIREGWRVRSGTRGAGSLPLALAVVTVCAVYLCAPARGKTAETRAKPSAPESMV